MYCKKHRKMLDYAHRHKTSDKYKIISSNFKDMSDVNTIKSHLLPILHKICTHMKIQVIAGSSTQCGNAPRCILFMAATRNVRNPVWGISGISNDSKNKYFGR